MPRLLSLTAAAALAAMTYTVNAAPMPANAGVEYPFFPVKGSGEWAPHVDKARGLNNQLSLEEKVTMVTGIGWQKGPCVGNIAPVPKIGFPGLCLQDSPAGIRFADGNSVFPASINVAATFDKTLMEENGKLMGAEFRGKGINVALTPMMNMARVPEGGRNWEGQGADPYLAAISASLQVKGVESQGVIATAKHFIGNEQEHARESASSNIDDRTLHEFYLPPFEECVKAGAGAIMCAYNRVNGTYACENPHLLETVLKGELDFNGFVMTDWWAGMSGAPTALGGSDMMMPGGATQESDPRGETYWGKNLVEMVNNGTVPVQRVDDMVTRILAAWLKAGQDKDFPAVNMDSWDKNKDKHVDVQAEHKNHIRAVGAASTILLKNDGGVLPLKQGLKTVGVIGLDAKTPENPNEFNDRSGVNGNVALGWGSGTANYPYLVGPYDGIKAQAEPLGINVLNSFDDNDLGKAAEIAKQSEMALVFVYANSGEGYLTVNGNQGDRNDLNLWGNGDALVKAVADNNPNTVVVINAPGAVNMPWISHPNIKSVVFAMMPGQESGNGLADVLFGKVNPSGRLPFTINKRPEDYVAHVVYVQNTPPSSPNFTNIDYTEGLLVDYRYNDAKNIEPLFAFGHGLSYTTFGYSDISAESNGSKATVRVTVTNTGYRAGHEVVQLYLSAPAVAQKPFKELKGFDRVYLNPGESKTLTFEVPERALSFWSTVDGKWVLAKGEFEALVGASSRDIKAQSKFTV